MSITEQHYTKRGEHPEDRIFRDREYIKRLQEHIFNVEKALEIDLRLNERGQDALFDYIHNCDEEIEFSDYLNNNLGLEYEEVAFKKERKKQNN